MLQDKMKTQIIGQVKITDKDTGKVLLKKKNAIHPGNMAYIIASALADQPTNINPGGATPAITWMGFGNGGSTSTTTISYRSPRVSGVYDGLPISASNSALYSPVYYQQTENEVFYPGQIIDTNTGAQEIIPANTSKLVFTVDMDHDRIEEYTGVVTPETDSSTGPEVETYTFDEIALISGVTTNGEIDLDKSLMVTHVTFHPILLPANRNIKVEYTLTIQIN